MGVGVGEVAWADARCGNKATCVRAESRWQGMGWQGGKRMRPEHRGKAVSLVALFVNGGRWARLEAGLVSDRQSFLEAKLAFDHLLFLVCGHGKQGPVGL